jgi:hypothetical protein
MSAPALRPTRLALIAVLCAPGCASLEFTRETETSGRFRSSGLALTVFGYDFPSGALQIARDNASDARQPNTVVTSQRVFPYLGSADWILDILSVRWARISGTWGFAPGSGIRGANEAASAAPSAAEAAAPGSPGTSRAPSPSPSSPPPF